MRPGGLLLRLQVRGGGSMLSVLVFSSFLSSVFGVMGRDANGLWCRCAVGCVGWVSVCAYGGAG